MRLLALGLAALLLSACGRHNAETAKTAAQSGPGCARMATRQLVWTNPDAPDTITARADGPTCRQAVVQFAARNADGDPLWTFASTYHDMTAGGAAPADAPAVSDEQMDRFLQGWANVTAQRTRQLPEWRSGATSPGAGERALAYSTPLTRETYQALRERDLRMICYAAAVSATQCLVVDPSTNAPTMIAAYGS
jgi:hypothetical protein